MSAVVNRRRNIFINSEQYHQTNGDVNLIFPGVDFAVDKNEIMRLSLESFTMPRRFYNINSNNNTFYIRNTATTPDDFSKCVITPGDYEVATFKTALKNAIDTVIGVPNTVVTISPTTRFIKIDLTAVSEWTADHDFVCFQVPPGRAGTNPNPTQITQANAFNDSCEILGGIPTKDFNDIVSAFSKSSTGVFTSVYPFSLESIESIHLVTNLQTHSYQTPDFLENSETSSLVPSAIFAKIPIFHQVFEIINSTIQKIQYTDSGSDAYAVDLQNKSLNSIILSLRDDKGRRLPVVGDNQYKDGNLSFLATLKWCAISKPEVGQVSGFLTDNMQMNLYNN